MLQDKLYPGWAKGVRRWWNAKYHRIILFWVTIIVTSTVVVMVISTDWINWDTLNRDFLPRNELARGFLASFILVLDLVIVMQVCCSIHQRSCCIMYRVAMIVQYKMSFTFHIFFKRNSLIQSKIDIF